MHYQLTIKDLEYQSLQDSLCFYLFNVGSSRTKDPHLVVIKMASRNSNKASPLHSSCKIYDDWCQMPPENQRAVTILSSNGKALDAALELDEEVFSGRDGVKHIMACLDKLYQKDDILSKFHTLEFFETYNRPSTLSITEYINEFEKCLNEIKNY